MPATVGAVTDVRTRLSTTDDWVAEIDAARQGDDEAFRSLYREVHPNLLRYLRALVGADAEDVASEAWLHIIRDLHTFQGDGAGFRAWAATVARHRAMDHLRRSRSRPVSPIPLDALPDQPGPQDTAGQAFESLSARAAVALIATLPREQGEAVLLRVLFGLNVEVTARILGKRPGAVRTSTYRGLRRLAQLLGPDRPEEVPS